MGRESGESPEQSRYCKLRCQLCEPCAPLGSQTAEKAARTREQARKPAVGNSLIINNLEEKKVGMKHFDMGSAARSARHFIFCAAAALLLVAMAGCNKDDVIPPGETDYPEGFRPATAVSSPYQNRVYEYTPAPGQFINDTQTAGFTGAELTAEEAAAFAESRLMQRRFVSLGSFGGYIVAGFDHSIACSGGYDFAILGNATDRSNEPGIVWVMQDTNGNGLPDDRWYELRGSESGTANCSQGYSVTYFKPSAPSQPVEWIDSDGNAGAIEYLPEYHSQPSYYPSWIDADSFTLSGTRLEARNSVDASGVWTNAPFAWGYADNVGSDSFGEFKQWTAFKISNAMRLDGSAADLEYIDFVKVQQSVLAQSGWIGENSCEVFCIADYSMLLR